MTDYAFITINQGNNGTEISGNTQAEQLYQLKRIADALEIIAANSTRP
jgi:hypothetical protein